MLFMEISRLTNYTLTPGKCSHAPWHHRHRHITASVLEAKETWANVEEQVTECIETKHADRAEYKHLLSLVEVTAYTSPQYAI